ncbi:MAG: ribose-phosphate pyrophosphokinase [Candidatus Dadabacteria bacterium]|nr:MAG: ribose-phosphate pyrophosphokinase [Candidatus Dadabacteria bacterium]
MRPLVFALPPSERFADALAGKLDAERGKIELHRFPDGETSLRLLTDCQEREVIVVATLIDPDPKLLPLALLTQTARELGAARVRLVTPYLAYMRQDKRFRPGEAVSNRIFARMLSELADELWTFDAHLHRVASIDDLFDIPAHNLHAAPALSDWIANNIDRPLLVGPDEESQQWVQDVAERAGAPFTVLRKERHGDYDVRITLADPNVDRTRQPVLVDDIISTARTMAETANILQSLGLRAPVAVAVHGLFAGDALHALRKAGVNRIVTSNTVPGPFAEIDVTPMLAEALDAGP